MNSQDLIAQSADSRISLARRYVGELITRVETNHDLLKFVLE
jgi:hypothetical protein